MSPLQRLFIFDEVLKEWRRIKQAREGRDTAQRAHEENRAEVENIAHLQGESGRPCGG